MEQRVILVDEQDREIGTETKSAAHAQGRLHRAFSIFVVNRRGEVLLQRRASDKYHSGGLWSNACCSHPRPGESTEEAAHRRLRQEMGIDCRLVAAFTFHYEAPVGNGLVEHELDHVFVGHHDGDPDPDETEVEDWRWASPGEVIADLEADPGAYSAWFGIALGTLLEHDLLEPPG